MMDTQRPHVAKPQLRGTGQGQPVPSEVHAAAVQRMRDGERTADTRRWLWQSYGLVVSPTTLDSWRRT